MSVKNADAVPTVVRERKSERERDRKTLPGGKRDSCRGILNPQIHREGSHWKRIGKRINPFNWNE